MNKVRRHVRRRRGAKNKSWLKKMKTWQKILLCVGCVLILAVISAGMYVMAKWNKIDTQKIDAEDLVINQEVQVKKNEELDLGEGYTNVALFGVDSRDGNLGKGNRTDCIIVASLNNETKEIKLVSVYRDTLLDLSDGTYQKCNAAYSYGGPVTAINMLNMNLDLDIQDYITVDFGAIADAIDLLGGIELDITDEEALYINQFLQETADSAGKEAHFLNEGGHLLLDGSQATTYARIRSTAGGDFTRTERQRLVIQKMFEKARAADLGTINAIIDKVFPQISTSFTLQEVLMYASAYSEYTLGENIGFPVDKTTDTISGLGSIVIPQDLTSNVTKLHEFLFGTTGYTPSSTVQKINANIISKVSAGQSSSSDNENDQDDYEYDEKVTDKNSNSSGNYSNDSETGQTGGASDSGSGSGGETGGAGGDTGSNSGNEGSAGESGSGAGGEAGGDSESVGETGGESSGQTGEQSIA